MRKALSLATIAAAACGFGIGAVAVYAQATRPQTQTVQAQTFVLVDGTGKKMGEWLVDNTGQPELRMFDASGKVIWSSKLRPVPLAR